MARRGFFGSSLNPPTMGHLVSAHEMMVRRKLDTVTFLPTSNKREDKEPPKISDEHRWNMLQLAIKNNPRFNASDHEMIQDAWNIYTYHTMQHFKKVYPDDDLFFLMGADLLDSLPSWRYGEELIKENKFIVIKRKVNGMDIPMEEIMAKHKLLRKYEDHFDFIHKGVANETSSSFIRDEFEIGNDPRYYVPDDVYDYILKHNLYK